VAGRFFWGGCIVTCFLAGFFFSSSFFKRLETNTSLVAPTVLLEVSACFLPTSVVIHSSGLLPFDGHSLKMGDEFSHFIFSSFDACRLTNVSRLSRQLLTLDSRILRFTSISEKTCSWNDNKSTSQQSCFRYWICDKCARVQSNQANFKISFPDEGTKQLSLSVALLTNCVIYEISPYNTLWRLREGAEVYLYSFFNLSNRQDVRSTPRSGRFNRGKQTRYPLHRRLRGPHDQAERVRKIQAPPPPGRRSLTVQHTASRYTDWAIPVHTAVCYGPSNSILSATNRNRSRHHNERTHSITQALTYDRLTETWVRF
jgi:hypothetical protein